MDVGLPCTLRFSEVSVSEVVFAPTEEWSKLIKGFKDRIFVLSKIDVWSTVEGKELFITVDFSPYKNGVGNISATT